MAEPKCETVVRPPVTHKLKTWPEYFDAVALGVKTFEVREDDRGYRVGDLLYLCEWCPKEKAFTGATCLKRVTYILHGGQFGIEADCVVMGLAEVVNAAAIRARKSNPQPAGGCGPETPAPNTEPQP